METTKEVKRTYLSMVEEAIKADASKTGSSKQVIVKYLVDQCDVDPEKSKLYIKSALKKGLESGALKMAKESGKGSNHYKLKTPPKTKKTAAAKPAEPKAPKAAKSPKVAADKKEAKAPAAKKPKAAAKKPKTSESEASTTPKKKKTLANKVKADASKPKKTPTKKTGKKAAAATKAK